MSSGLRLRRPVFFAAGLRCPVCLRRIALCPVFLSVFRLSSRLPSFSCRPAFPTARISHCPCFSLPVSPSVRVSLSPHLPSFVGSSSVVCIPSGFSSVISCFSVHRPSLAVCCPSPVAPSIVQRLPLVVRRPLSIPCRPLSVVRRPSFAARCSSPVASPVPRRLYLYPVARPAAPLSAAVRSGSRLLYPRNPGLRVCGSCLPCRSAAGSVGRSFRKNAPPLRTLVAAPFLTK